jgi:hypothetical protein
MLWNLSKRVPHGAAVRCNWCRAQLAVQASGGLHPPAPELYARGAVSVNGLGWFCARRCVTSYEARFRVILEPELQGNASPRSA